MIWPGIKQDVELKKVRLNDTVDDLFIWAANDGEDEYLGVLYDCVWTSQLMDEHTGLMLTDVTEIGWDELKDTTEPYLLKFMEEQHSDNRFADEMKHMGYRLFVHHAANGEKYIVMAAECRYGNPSRYHPDNAREGVI
ncbi:MAG: hypothetical protein LBU94_03110 [Clostridiales bacterium]|nr:hypothetical protein [Clostridiales bacterium]